MMLAGPVTAFNPASVDFQLFALFLDAERVRRGRTVGQVAREAEVMPDAVFRAVAARNPGEDEYFALCTWLGMEPDSFMTSGHCAETGEERRGA